jgi:hypothetical protein
MTIISVFVVLTGFCRTCQEHNINMKILWLTLLLVFFVRAGEPIDFKNGLVQTYAGTGE